MMALVRSGEWVYPVRINARQYQYSSKLQMFKSLLKIICRTSDMIFYSHREGVN
jgi:hypothetical protein